MAKSAEVRTARLERKHFELCMGSLKDLIGESRKHDPVFAYYNQKHGSESRGTESAVRPVEVCLPLGPGRAALPVSHRNSDGLGGGPVEIEGLDPPRGPSPEGSEFARAP